MEMENVPDLEINVAVGSQSARAHCKSTELCFN